MRTVKIETIKFENFEVKSENYPYSGIFISDVKKGTSDLRWVDKNVEINYCIVPAEIFQKVAKFEETTELPAIQETISEPQKYDGDFILEFSRILLNRK